MGTLTFVLICDENDTPKGSEQQDFFVQRVKDCQDLFVAVTLFGELLTKGFLLHGHLIDISNGLCLSLPQNLMRRERGTRAGPPASQGLGCSSRLLRAWKLTFRSLVEAQCPGLVPLLSRLRIALTCERPADPVNCSCKSKFPRVRKRWFLNGRSSLVWRAKFLHLL